MPAWLDRRLLPVLGLLLAALVAAPFVLRPEAADEPGTPAPAPPRSAAAPGTTSGAPTPVVAPVTASDRAGRRRVVGEAKDPFKPTNQPKRDTADRDRAEATSAAAAATVSATSAAGGASGGAKATLDTPGESTPRPLSPAPAPTPATPVARPRPVEPRTPSRYAIDVRTTRGSNVRTLRDVPRLSALPSSAHPVLVYLGLLADHETAVFLVPSVVDVVSDAECKPSRANCERVHLEEDETMSFEQTLEGRTVRYELTVRDIHKRRTPTSESARKATAALENRRLARWLVSLQPERLDGLRWDAGERALVYPKR